MGEVFMAEHRSMQRRVALKILPRRWISQPDSIERFYEEVRAASRLLHPNIVTAFDAGQSEGVHFLAMEYVDGKTLTQVVADEGPMPIGDAASAIRQAAFALHHAHTAGIVHRDVKPGNLMRAFDGTIKLLDLGLAQFAANVQPQDWASSHADQGSDADPHDDVDPPQRSFVGTLSYISPEQLEDAERADHRSDQYSLGATLFFLLMGRPPFVGELIDQVYGHRHGDVPDLMAMRDDIDLTFANVVRRMLAKDPEARYGSMDEVARAIAPYDNDRSTPAWVLDFARRDASGEQSTAVGDSTRRSRLKVMGIEMGMTHACTATAGGDGEMVAGQPVRGDNRALFRLAVANDSAGNHEDDRSRAKRTILFDDEAYQQRRKYPERVAHCQMMYFGRDDMYRQIGDRMCPPEVATALCLRHLVGNTLHSRTDQDKEGDANRSSANRQWRRHPDWPDAFAITLPACYDQLHRRAIHVSARLAGLTSVRLIDRSLAAARYLQLNAPEKVAATSLPGEQASPAKACETLLYVGLTGQALDVAVVRREGEQLQQIASAGHACYSTMAWSGRLVELISAVISDAPQRKRQAPTSRRSLVRAAKIQMAGERAMHALLLLPETDVIISNRNQEDSVHLTRAQWLHSCEDLIEAIPRTIKSAIDRAQAQLGTSDLQIDRMVVMGNLLRMPALRKRCLEPLVANDQIVFLDRGDVALGAASCVAAELPGQRRGGPPVKACTSHSVGFVVADQHGKRKILPIIPRGTATPARTNRALGGKVIDNHWTLSLVESSGPGGTSWQSLGRHSIDIDGREAATKRRLGFEIDINGLLSVHLERPDLGRTVMLPSLPRLPVTPDQFDGWREWVEANV
ncbi:MAG: protein kinase, partial [Planctomycetota bacterium]